MTFAAAKRQVSEPRSSCGTVQATQLTGQLLNLVHWLLGELVLQVRGHLAGAFVAGRLHRERELCGAGWLPAGVVRHGADDVARSGRTV